MPIHLAAYRSGSILGKLDKTDIHHEVGERLRHDYDDGKITTETEFLEVLGDVLFNRKTY
jgi:hypothetical protein